MIETFLGSIPAMIVTTGILVGVAASLVGTFLVLRGSAMLTDAISHSIVFGIILVWLLTRDIGGPLSLLGAGATGVLTVVLSEALARSRLVASDAAIGLVFPALFAAGVLLISLFARDVHIHAESVLLGEIAFVWLDTVEIAGHAVPVTVLTLLVVLAVNLAFVVLLWKELELAVFDPALAAALGLAPGLIFYALLTLTSITAVASFDAVGAILFIAFVIVPPATAFLLTRNLLAMILVGCAVAVASSLIGYAAAVALDVSIGGMMATTTGAFFALALVFAPDNGLLAQAIARRTRRLDGDCMALVAHLHTHQDTSRMEEENTRRALVEHLGWAEARAGAVVLRALDRDLVARDGRLLRLTEKGEATARGLFEPWARGRDRGRERGRGTR